MILRKLFVKFKIVQRKTQDNLYKEIIEKFVFPSSNGCMRATTRITI